MHGATIKIIRYTKFIFHTKSQILSRSKYIVLAELTRLLHATFVGTLVFIFILII